MKVMCNVRISDARPTLPNGPRLLSLTRFFGDCREMSMSRDLDQNEDHIEHREDLVTWFREGIKTPEQRKIGTEHEKFGYITDASGKLRPMPWEGGIERMMTELSERYGWHALRDQGKITALERDGAAITVEPGGQFELSGAPFATLDETEAELDKHLEEVEVISRELDFHWLGMGARPLHTLDEVPWMPKSRYKIMADYLPTRGKLAHYMMKMSCTIQANFDYTSEADAANILNTVLTVTPIVSGLFASSPFLAGQPTDHITSRCHFWTATDPDRTGYVPGMLEPGYTFDDYVDYLLDTPMVFIRRDGRYLDATGRTFARFLEEGLDGHRAILGDWELHVSTSWPEVRMKRYIEVRGADMAPAPFIPALSALWKGILYDNNARTRARALTEGLSLEQRLTLHRAMIDHGLAARLPDGGLLLERARELVQIAEDGLVAQGCAPERRFLEVLHARVLEPGASLAEQLVSRFQTGNTVEDAIADLWIGAQP